ncbi:hypothetical protein ALT761_01981 [Alteromonas sp. 76-1]|uniref:hypothetical protein n=1 Tax=Alteromonas sp. 76-1 TaxID=2358187 RepID=UPI000FD15C11|nr:hypothetical protein [Alteromonas sp. 76-1]VEL96982.1 hypothetical protein ALT761_01981 [Alteromonas sp. 76-1]
MNQAELEALSDNTLTPFAVTLYMRCFYKNRGYSDGLVHVSQRSMRNAMEHTPPRGSTKCAGAPSRETIRTAIRQLEKAGLIELAQKGDLKEQKAALFYCTLAHTKSLRPNEEQPESNQGTTSNKKFPHPTAGNAYSGNVVNLKKFDEQPIPTKPIEDEEDNACARENLEFCGDWVGLANQAGWSGSNEEAQALFNKWKLSDSANTYRHITTHRKYWMRYCAAIRHNQVKGVSHALNQQSSQQRGYRNATATAMRDCIERAQRGEGVEAFDFSNDQA